ncbi:MAG TPA: T9SS type A sorting domain-containing protein [Rhodothermales bacterium]|nr:T9SS type A sorting domain-containing protein [Rhodothermales bacterium]
MRKALSLFTILLIPALASGQMVWEEEGGFPDDTTFTENMHGVAVDAEGKVWLTPFFASAWLDPVTGDSLRDASGAALSTVAIYVYNPDGTEAFTPIRTITVDGVTDTLFSSARGLRADHNGNILHVDGSGNMWRIDHTTGEGMNHVVPGALWSNPSMAQPAVTNDGTIFVGAVIQNNPIQIYSEDFEFVGTAVDTARGFSRGFEVSGDGNTIYWGGFTNGELHVYSRADEFSPFGDPDTLWRGIWAESFTRDQDGNIWISNDSRADSGTVWADPENWLRWRVFDPEFGKFTDQHDHSFQFTLEFPSDPITEFARGMAFAPDGNTAYAVLWDVNTSGQVAPERQVAVKKFVRKNVTAIERIGDGIPTAFTLEQNYPNPFNPSTQIAFTLTEPGVATLKVYDSYGRLVRTLVDEHMVAGTYAASFHADGLASGNYFYHLEVNGQYLTGTMTLLK